MSRSSAMEGRERGNGAGRHRAYHLIRQWILDLTLPPGTVLDETRIGLELGLSRTPVREAFMLLLGEGLIDSADNRMMTVARLDLSAIDAFCDAYHLMLRVTARAAALKHIAGDLEPLFEALDAPQRGEPLYRCPVIALCLALHSTLISGAGPGHMTAMFDRLRIDAERILHQCDRAKRLELTTAFRAAVRTVLEAIVLRDVAAADAAVRDYASLFDSRIIISLRGNSRPAPQALGI